LGPEYHGQTSDVPQQSSLPTIVETPLQSISSATKPNPEFSRPKPVDPEESSRPSARSTPQHPITSTTTRPKPEAPSQPKEENKARSGSQSQSNQFSCHLKTPRREKTFHGQLVEEEQKP
jgi:hypothetical protein